MTLGTGGRARAHIYIHIIYIHIRYIESGCRRVGELERALAPARLSGRRVRVSCPHSSIQVEARARAWCSRYPGYTCRAARACAAQSRQAGPWRARAARARFVEAVPRVHCRARRRHVEDSASAQRSIAGGLAWCRAPGWAEAGRRGGADCDATRRREARVHASSRLRQPCRAPSRSPAEMAVLNAAPAVAGLDSLKAGPPSRVRHPCHAHPSQTEPARQWAARQFEGRLGGHRFSQHFCCFPALRSPFAACYSAELSQLISLGPLPT